MLPPPLPRPRAVSAAPTTAPVPSSVVGAVLRTAHPLFVWRSKGVVYYLIGDSVDIAKRAAKIAGAPN